MEGPDKQPWFVGKDVAIVLGYRNTPDAIARQCKAQTTIAKPDGGFLTILPERDVYRLIIRSRLPKAEAFD